MQQSSCHGHCQLDKKLTEDTGQEQQSTASRLEELPMLSLFIPILQGQDTVKSDLAFDITFQ